MQFPVLLSQIILEDIHCAFKMTENSSQHRQERLEKQNMRHLILPIFHVFFSERFKLNLICSYFHISCILFFLEKI